MKKSVRIWNVNNFVAGTGHLIIDCELFRNLIYGKHKLSTHIGTVLFKFVQDIHKNRFSTQMKMVSPNIIRIENSNF